MAPAKRGALQEPRTQGVVRKSGDPAWRFGVALWKAQFQHLARDFLTTCKWIVNVAACLDRLAVSDLQAFFFVGLRESLVCPGVLSRQKKINRFPKFPCY